MYVYSNNGSFKVVQNVAHKQGICNSLGISELLGYLLLIHTLEYDFLLISYSFELIQKYSNGISMLLLRFLHSRWQLDSNTHEISYPKSRSHRLSCHPFRLRLRRHDSNTPYSWLIVITCPSFLGYLRVSQANSFQSISQWWSFLTRMTLGIPILRVKYNHENIF